jgi:uncharacterized protein
MRRQQLKTNLLRISDEQKNVKFVVTGSNSFLMSHDLLTLLSGRTLPIEVYPLSFSEFIAAKTTIQVMTPLALAQHRHEIRLS